MKEAGKGVRPCPSSRQYRDNWNKIDWVKKPENVHKWKDLKNCQRSGNEGN